MASRWMPRDNSGCAMKISAPYRLIGKATGSAVPSLTWVSEGMTTGAGAGLGGVGAPQPASVKASIISEIFVISHPSPVKLASVSFDSLIYLHG